MRKTHSLRRHGAVLALGTVLLASCGGGGGDGGGPVTPPAAGSDIPASATSSSQGAFNFVNATAASADNTAEPLVVGDASLATSDTDEPAAL